MQLGDLEKEKEKLSASLDEYRKSIEKMEYDLSLPKEDYIEKYAREVLGYHKNGELVFIPAEDWVSDSSSWQSVQQDVIIKKI